MTAKVKLILNPIANLGRTEFEQIVSPTGGADWITSTHPNYASELACKSATEEYDMVSMQPLFIHLDGEIFSSPETRPVTTLSAGIMPDAIQVVC